MVGRQCAAGRRHRQQLHVELRLGHLRRSTTARTWSAPERTTSSTSRARRAPGPSSSTASRRAPPTGFVAGRNGAIGVEFEWNPNTERDVSGYRVYRVAGAAPSAADTLVCSTRTTDRLPTSCRDTDALAAAPTLHYYVVAVAPARPPATGEEESPRPTILEPDVPGVEQQCAAQSAVTELTATPPGDGTVELTWSDPVSPACRRGRRHRPLLPDLPRRRAMPTATTVRARATGTTSSIRIPAREPTRYSVTTVDSRLAESAPVTIAGVGP